MDLERIGKIAGAECERQQVGVYEFGQLLKAYSAVLGDNDAFRDPLAFQTIGAIVEPVKNRHGFRVTPVTFENQGTAANAQDIPRLMENLCQSIGVNTVWDNDIVDSYVKQFLWIHPFRDGNGRVSWILHNYLSGTMDYPHSLPDYGW